MLILLIKDWDLEFGDCGFGSKFGTGTQRYRGFENKCSMI